MQTDPDIRPGETAVDLSPAADAALRLIGRIRTPWPTREGCRRQVFYWLDRSRRDLGRQSPRSDGRTVGTPLLDIKPDPCAFTPKAPAKEGAD